MFRSGGLKSPLYSLPQISHNISHIWEEPLGPHDPNVATVLENMAQLYRELGEKEEAIRLDERARAIRAQH